MRAFARLAGSAIAGLLALGTVSATATTTAEPAEAPVQPTQLTIAAQDYNVQPGRNLQMSLKLAANHDALQLGGDATVVVSIGVPLTDRDQLGDALSGVFSAVEDSVTLPIAQVPRTHDTLFIGVPTETGIKRREELRLPERGLAPIRIELVDGGRTVAEMVSFVHRDVGEGRPVQVSLAVGVQATATLDAQGLPRIDETAIADVERLGAFLQTTTLPVLIDLAPSVVQAISRQRPDLYATLEAAARGHAVSSRPSLPLDPSGTAAAGAGALYQSWLTAGDGVTRSMLSAVPERSVYVMPQPLTPGGAELLRANGVRMLLSPYEVLDRLDNSPRVFYDSSAVVRVATIGNHTVDLKVPDGRIAALIDRSSSDPKLSAIRVLSELLMIRQIAAANGSAGERAVVLATPHIGVPDTDVVGELTALIGQTGAVQPVEFSQLAADPTPMRVNGKELTVGLVGATAFDVGGRINLADRYRARSNDVASMLPAGDTRRQLWLQQLEQFPTSALSDSRVGEITAELDRQHREVLDAVVPPAPFAVTLGGLEATLHLRVRNTSTTPLKVRLHMSSGAAKLTFPANDLVAELAPLTLTDLEIPVVARSRGKFPIFVQVLTPAAVTAIGGPVPLTARVNALSGVGNVITYALLGVLLLWWLRTFRRTRRKRATTLPGP